MFLGAIALAGFVAQLVVLAWNLRLTWRVRSMLRENQAALDQGAAILVRLDEQADLHVIYIATDLWLRLGHVAILYGSAVPIPPWQGGPVCRQPCPHP